MILLMQGKPLNLELLAALLIKHLPDFKPPATWSPPPDNASANSAKLHSAARQRLCEVRPCKEEHIVICIVLGLCNGPSTLDLTHLPCAAARSTLSRFAVALLSLHLPVFLPLL